MNEARPGPGGTRAAVIAAALLVGPQVASKATRDTLFLSSFEVASLPLIAAAAAVVSLGATLAFSRAMRRLTPARVLPAMLGGSALLFGAEWALALVLPRPAAVLVYLHHAVLGAVLISSFWSLMTERFDPHAAKRSLGAIGAGASLGGVAGGLFAWRAASLVSVPTMLLALAGASLLGLASVLNLAPQGPLSEVQAPEPEALPARSGLRLIREVPYLRSLAWLVLLGAFLDAVLDYVMSAAATASFGRGAALMSFFALFHASAALVALIAQVTLVRPLLQGSGLAVTLGLQPAFAAVGAALCFAFPRLLTVVALRGGQAVLRNSAFRASYELLYTPLPAEQKRPSKVIVDVGCDRLGAIAGSAAILLVLSLAPGSATRTLLALSALAATLALALAPCFRAGYVTALATSLRSGSVALEPGSIVEPTTLLTLASLQIEAPAKSAGDDPLLVAAADMRSGDLERIAKALVGPELHPGLVCHVIPLLAHDGLAPAAMRSLRSVAARATGQLVDALLDPTLEPAVRRRIPRVLKAAPTQRAADGLLLGLREDRFDLRYRCAQALLRLRESNPAVVLPAEAILAVAEGECAHLAGSERRLDHVFTVLALVLDHEPLGLALRAVRGSDARLRGTALEYLDNVLPVRVREKLWPHLAGSLTRSRTGRSTAEIRDDLLRSYAATSIAPPRSPRAAPSSQG